MNYIKSERVAQLITAALPVARTQDNDADLRGFVALCADSATADIVFALSTATATLSAELEALTGIPALNIVVTIAAALEAGEEDQ